MSDITISTIRSRIEEFKDLLSSITNLDDGSYGTYNFPLITSKRNDIRKIEEGLNAPGISSLDNYKALPENSKIPADRIAIVYQNRIMWFDTAISGLMKDMNEKHWTFEYKLFSSIQDYLDQYDKDSDQYKASFKRFGNRELKPGYSLLKSKQVLGADRLLKKDFSKYFRQMMITDNNNYNKVVSVLNDGGDTTEELNEYTVIK